MRVAGVEYDTWNWRFLVGEQIEFEGVIYDILSRDTKTDTQGVVVYYYTLQSLDGVARTVRNYMVNLEAQRAGVTCGKGEKRRKKERAYMQQLRDERDRGVQAAPDAHDQREAHRDPARV